MSRAYYQYNWDSKETLFILLNCCVESHSLNEYTEVFLTFLLVNSLFVWMLRQHNDKIKSCVINSSVINGRTPCLVCNVLKHHLSENKSRLYLCSAINICDLCSAIKKTFDLCSAIKKSLMFVV